MQRHVAIAIAGHQRIEGVEVLGVGHLDIRQPARRALALPVQAQIRARRVVDRQQRIVAAMHDQRRLAAQIAVAQRQPLADLQRKGLRRIAGHQIAQAARARGVGVVHRRARRARQQIAARTARVQVVDQLHAGRRRHAVAGREHVGHLRLRHRRGLERRVDAAEAVAAQPVRHAGARQRIGIGHRHRAGDFKEA
ncbi:hypothetical protein GCM10009078_48500 [Cupriavidus gilardii]